MRRIILRMTQVVIFHLLPCPDQSRMLLYQEGYMQSTLCDTTLRAPTSCGRYAQMPPAAFILLVPLSGMQQEEHLRKVSSSARPEKSGGLRLESLRLCDTKTAVRVRSPLPHAVVSYEVLKSIVGRTNSKVRCGCTPAVLYHSSNTCTLCIPVQKKHYRNTEVCQRAETGTSRDSLTKDTSRAKPLPHPTETDTIRQRPGARARTPGSVL